MSPTEEAVTGEALARAFYEDHQAQFLAAASAPDVKSKGFALTTAEFDAWLVSHGQLDAPASDFDTMTKERIGTTTKRYKTRDRINRAARKTPSLEMFSSHFPAFSIGPPNREGQMRAKLIALYAKDAPGEIAHKMQGSARHYERMIGEALRVIEQQPDVLAEDKLLARVFAGTALPIIRSLSGGVIDALHGAQRAVNRKQRAQVQKPGKRRP